MELAAYSAGHQAFSDIRYQAEYLAVKSGIRQDAGCK